MRNSFKYLSIIIVMMMIAISVSPVSAYNNSVFSINNLAISPEIRTIISDYSQLLSSGKPVLPLNYTPQMMALANERRGYYNEYFEVGLHSKLLTINSNYSYEDATISLIMPDNQYHVSINETVDFQGRYEISNVDDFPLIKASKWALTQANSSEEKGEINSRIKSLQEDVTNSSGPAGFTTTFNIQHDLLISNNGVNSQILQDAFTDKASDNGTGVDNVNWKNGTFSRSKPDLTQSPTYIWWNKNTTEELGQNYLDSVGKTINARKALYKSLNLVMQPANSIYNRANALYYADHYTSSPNSGSCGNQYMDQRYWSMYYTKYCADCANYVSQVLNYGGIPISSLWHADTMDWIQVVPLYQYMVAYYYAVSVSSIGNLSVGDFMLTDDRTHTVILTTLAPPKYSGHTNDRKEYPAAGMGFNNYFYHITY